VSASGRSLLSVPGLSTWGALGVALLAPWPFASVEPFWWALAACLILSFAATGQASACVRGTRVGELLPRSAIVLAVALPCVGALGALPLPAFLVDRLSPGNVTILSGALSDGPPSLRTLSLFAPATWDAVLMAAACAALAWMVADRSQHSGAAKNLCSAFVVGGAFIAVFGLAQRLIDPDPQQMFWSVEIYEVGTPFGPYVNRNHFGGAMLLFLGAAIGLVARARALEQTVTVVATAAAATLFAVALLATTSRGAVLGAACLLCFLIVFSPGKARWRLIAACAGLCLVAIAGLAAAGLLDDLSGRLFNVYGRWRNRFLVQRDALGVFAEFPLVGTGAGTFPWVFHAFQSVDDARHFGDAHSDWVQFLMETGLVGAGYVVALVTMLGRRARSVVSSASPDRWLVMGALAGLVGLAAHGFVETNLHIPANAFLAAVAVGLAYGASGGLERSADSQVGACNESTET
jgi:O-antigen ligase